MKKLILLTLINFSCFSMELNYPENQIAIFSNNSDQPIFLDSSAIQYSPFLKAFFESRKEFKAEDIKINLPYEQLKNSLNLINLFLESNKDSSKEVILTNLLQQLSLQDLINSYFVADYFIMNEMKEYLSLLFNKPKFIERLAQLDKEQLQALEFIKTKDFLPDQAPIPLLKNVNGVYWSPDKSRYFVKFNDKTARLFDKDGNSIGDLLLRNVFYVNWSPDGCYFVGFYGHSAQLFDKDTNSIGNPLLDVFLVYWSPDGSRYFVKYNDETAQLFDKNGNPVGNILNNIFSISWLADGSRYFVRYNNASGQLFDNNGNPVGNILNNIFSISWSADGSRYFVKFYDNSRRLFDKNGNSIDFLNDVSCIYWSPDGSMYFVEYNNDSGQLFDKCGNTIGNILNNIFFIYWSADGSRYFVRYNNASGQLFDNNGNPVGNILNNIFSISWLADGSRYFVRYINDSRQLFDNGKSILYFPRKSGLNSQRISDNTLMLVLKGNLYKNELKFLVEDLANEYQVYRAKDKLPIGKPIKNKPLWFDTNTFAIEKDDQNEYYSYQELSLPDLVNSISRK